MKSKTINKICVGIITLLVAGCATLTTITSNQNKEINSLENKVSKLNTKYKNTENLYNELLNKEKTSTEIQNTLDSIEETIDYAASIYGVDKTLLIAIMRTETGNFTSNVWLTRNNAGGMKDNGEYYYFPTPEIGILEVARMLRFNYIEKGMTTPEQMANTYCPPNSDEWIQLVRSIMNEYQS